MADQKKRRARDPEATREAILEAARTLLAKSGPEGVSLSEVAHLAGVNRGTAYQHFETREKLIQETAKWVSDKLFRAAFGDPETISERRVEEVDIADLTDRLSGFAIENPELCRVWLMQMLASSAPMEDPFWREYCGSLERFSVSDMAEPGIDSEVLAMLNLSGIFLWPVWSKPDPSDVNLRSQQARRFANECLRLSLYGSVKAKQYPQVEKRLREEIEGLS